jgi:diacylglycerol kinase (ATP)
MRATLLHNPKSGDARSNDELVKAFADVGWDVHQCLHKKELESCLAGDFGDAVIVAGGDGTVGRVAKRLAGTDIPLVVLPTGTANNIARSLGIGIDCDAVIAGLSKYAERTIDVGTLKSREGDEGFLEGFGVGVFAYVVGEVATKKHKKIHRGLELIADTLEKYEPRHFMIDVDGTDLSGEYLLVCAMNVRSFGPALGFAPHARMDDGLLDLVVVHPEGKEMLVSHLRRAAKEGDLALPHFETHQCKKVTLRADGRWAHCDDDPRELEGEVKIGIQPNALHVLVPAHTTVALAAE